MKFKQLVVDLRSKEAEVQDSVSFSLVTDSLAFLRGHVFFTSAFTVANKNGTFLACLDTHYERFKRCYRVLFERSDFPLSLDELREFVDQSIQENSHCKERNMSCLIFFMPSAARYFETSGGNYANGFGGNLVKMVILMKPYAKKPEWTYTSGVNLLTMPFQREVASAKPTHYMGGILGQHIVDAINVYAGVLSLSGVEKDVMKRAVESYRNLSLSDQQSFRLLMNDCRNQCLSSIDDYELSTEIRSLVRPLFNETLSGLDFLQLESSSFEDCLHEVLFCSSDESPYVLEGSTFSVMGIDSEDRCVFIPLHGNSKEAADTNSGTVLESTVSTLLQTAAKNAEIPFVVQKLKREELFNLKAFYVISTTRLSLEESGVRLQPVRSVDGKRLSQDWSESYDRLMQEIYFQLDNYSYSVDSVSKEAVAGIEC